MKYITSSNFSFFIFHSSLNFAKQNSFGRAASARSAPRVGLSAPSPACTSCGAGGSATIPLAGAPTVRLALRALNTKYDF
jgi:hypothetical protein